MRLPDVESYEPTGTGESPLAAIDEWVNCKCPKCGKPAKRETNTMPQWAGSSWYFLRYVDNHNDKELVSREKADKYLPVDMYIAAWSMRFSICCIQDSIQSSCTISV